MIGLISEKDRNKSDGSINAATADWAKVCSGYKYLSSGSRATVSGAYNTASDYGSIYR